MGEIANLSELSKAKQSEWVDRLFSRLGAMYGQRFADMWVGQSMHDVKEVWREELSDMTPEEVSSGVAACKTRDWPPTLPEFLKLCRPSLDYERAFVEAINQMQLRKQDRDTWSNPAVYWAAVKIGNDLSNFPYKALAVRWSEALDEAMAKARKGLLPEIPKRLDSLPAPGKTTVSQEEAQKRIAELRKGLTRGLRSPAQETQA